MKKLNKNKYFIIDDSLSLINRTGAFYIARELVKVFSGESKVRRWRLWGSSLKVDLLRKVYARLMLKEFELLEDKKILYWPEDKLAAFTLYLDPLYVLRNQLKKNDIVLCHDIGPITHPHLYYPTTTELYQKAYEKIFRSQAGVVFVSDFSKAAFMKTFGSHFRFLQSIPLYLRSNLAQEPATPLKDIKKPFLLTVGALEHRKNHALTIKAYQEGRFYERGYELIICGSRGDSADEIKSLVNQTQGVRLLGYVTDGELSWLYQNAKVFVLPSQFEGFGMPALEAAAFGLPLVISQNNALEEAVNGLGVAVTHTDSAEIIIGIDTILNLDKNQRDDLAFKLKDCAKNASQKKFIEQWKNLINQELAQA